MDLLYRYHLDTFPELATRLGERVGQDRWTDRSTAALNRLKRDEAKVLEVLGSLESAELDAGDQLDYELLLRHLEATARGRAFSEELLPVTQMGGLQQWVPSTLRAMPRRTVEDYENILARLDAFPALVDQTLVLLRRGLARGVTPPRVTLRDVPQQFLNLLADEALESPLLEAFRDVPGSIPPDERDRLLKAARSIYATKVEPAVEKIHRYLNLTYLTSARATTALKELPDGEAWYAYLAALYTTTDLTPRELHDLGLSEVDRIRAEMGQVIREIGFRGDYESFNEFLRTHSGFFYHDADEMLRGYRDVAKRADGKLLDLFGHLPRLPYGIKSVPPHAAPSQPAGYYHEGSLETGRSATFYVNTYDLRSRPRWRMESLTLHHAVPGHHLQLAVAQEREDLPWFRRVRGCAAFEGGWALYAERLGYEMGLYEDPYQKYGQLTGELWRALGLVVDTGIHAFGWSRQRAIDTMFRNTGRTRHEVEVEVDRHIVRPGQALAYKVGELKIREIRARAERELGGRFDVRAFHDELLGEGSLPLAVLETKMDVWIGSLK